MRLHCMSQIENFVKCKKFNKEDLFSIFEFYARNYNEVRDRELEWLNIEAAYKIHQTNKEDSKWVEERYKDWGLKDKIKVKI